MTMLTLTTGDTAPDMTGTVNADLTGATAVVAHIQPPGNATAITKTVTVTAPTTGGWTFAWAAGDLAAAGTYYLEIQVTFSSGEIQTFAGTDGTPSAFRARTQIA